MRLSETKEAQRPMALIIAVIRTASSPGYWMGGQSEMDSSTQVYKKELELVGVGYRAGNTGNLLELTLGYSHPIYFSIPDELKLTTAMEKGSNPAVILEGIDKQLIGEIASKIRELRKPEPYKGKGVRYKGEEVRRKAGKTAAS